VGKNVEKEGDEMVVKLSPIMSSPPPPPPPSLTNLSRRGMITTSIPLINDLITSISLLLLLHLNAERWCDWGRRRECDRDDSKDNSDDDDDEEDER